MKHDLPLKPVEPYRVPPEPTPAPAWVALCTAWGGLIVLIGSIVFVFLPGTKDPLAELEKLAPPAIADRFLPFELYGCTIALFLGIVVLFQMRRVPRPLPSELVMQRFQAWVGIVLSLIGAAVVYIDVGLRGPK